MKLNINLFESLVLVTIAAILMWVNVQVRVVSYEIHFKGLDGAIEWYGCGWPFMVTTDFNETDARKRRWDYQNWQVKEAAGNVAVALAILATALFALRFLKKSYLKIRTNGPSLRS